MAPESVPMTEQGMAKLRDEIDTLERRRPEIKKAIEEAREKGDLRENADYHAAREELAMLDAKLGQIHGLLANATVVDLSKAPKDTCVMGCTVTIKRLKDKKSIKRTLVGAGQEDPLGGKILTTSPIGKAVIGSKIGDKVTAELPAGPMDFEITAIDWE